MKSILDAFRGYLQKKKLLFSIVDDSVSDYNVEYFKEGNNLWINTLCRQILKKSSPSSRNMMIIPNNMLNFLMSTGRY